MPTDSTLPSSTASNQPSTSSASCYDDIQVEAKNSNVNVNRGNDNATNQYQDVPPSRIVPERITESLKTDSHVSPSNQSSTSSANSNIDTKIEANESNVCNIQGSSNKVIQYQVKQPPRPPERIEYNVQNPVKSFTGREDILEALHNAIESNRKNGDLTILASVVTGLGGIGKTETVKKYIQKYKATYGHVLWINSEKNSQLTDCLISIATLTSIISLENIDGKRKKDEEIAAEVYNFVCKKPAFIVFDNANSLLDEDGENGIGMLLPRSLQAGSINPAIVVTSRNRKWNNYQVISIFGFADTESYNLLRNQLLFQDTQENRSYVAEITHLCDGLPLVIQQVIQVIKMESEERETMNEDAYSMQDFLNDYHRGNKSYIYEKPYDSPVDLRTSHTVYEVFKLTCQKLSKKIEGGLALECLNILALLNPDGIPVDLLLSFFDDEIKDRVKKALVLLRNYNLLKVSGDIYTIHRMLQGVRIEMLRRLGGLNNFLSESIISSSIKFCEYLDTMPSNAANKFLILENGIRLANLIFKEKCGENSQSFLETLGCKFLSYGKYYNATYIYKTMLESTVCDNQELQVKYKEMLAQTYNLEGKYIESEQMYIDLLACDISKIHQEACESQSKLQLICCLGQVYLYQGKYDQAKALLQYVITQQAKFVNPRHILKTKTILATVFLSQGKYAEAEGLYTELLQSQMATLGPEHPDTLTTKNSLALVLKSQGKYTEAEELYTEVLNYQLVILGPEHPNTLTTKNNLGQVFYQQGKFTEAKELYTEVLEHKLVILGPEHPDTLLTKNNLASVFGSQGKYTEAEEAYTDVLNYQLVILGPEHPGTLTTKHNLASVFDEQGKFTEAEGLYTEVLKSTMVIFGPDHQLTVRTKNCLASVLASQGKYTEAEELYTDVLKYLLVILGPEHSNTLATKSNLAAVFSSQGKYAEAGELYTEVLKSKIVTVGPEHLDTLAARNNLAELHKREGKRRCCLQ